VSTGQFTTNRLSLINRRLSPLDSIQFNAAITGNLDSHAGKETVKEPPINLLIFLRKTIISGTYLQLIFIFCYIYVKYFLNLAA